ncbi:MAG: aldo/keto reductase [Myxococcota bacterium]
MTTSPTYGVLGPLSLPLGLGLLRLSTEGRPDEAAAIEVIHRALDAGIRVLDTADSYALDDKDLHYGERLVHKAVASWGGDAAAVRIVTKVGMARPKGRWVPAARPERLRKEVERSLTALGGEPIFLLLLHGNDPAVPFEDQLGALAALQREGKVRHLGLCNVDVAEIRQAQRHFDVAAIQNELSVLSRASATDGTLALAAQLGIPFLAHRPLGGHAKTEGLLKNRAMKPLAERLGVSPHEAALATLLDVGPPVVALFGATRPERVDAAVRAAALRLDEHDRALVRAKISFSATPEAEASLIPTAPSPRPLAPGAGAGAEPEVVVVLGVQGAGKTSLVDGYLAAGYARLNRDVLGGTLDDLVPALAAHLAAGQQRVVLDNTYPTRVSRWAVIRAAHAAGVPVRAVHMDTPMRDALINVVQRVLDRHGRLLGPDEMKALAKEDPNLPPPQALSRWAASFEPPSLDEGFAVVDIVPFQRRPGPVMEGARALLLDVDGTLRRTLSGENYPTHPDDIELLPGRTEVLRRWVDEGYRLYFVSNQSGVASEKVTDEAVRRCFDRTIELLGLPVAGVAFCPHPAFPAGCFCRKPMPGLGIHLARTHGFDPAGAIMVGDLESDAKFAEAIGAQYRTAEAFFGG